MTFTVTYREKDGTRAEIGIEAANRAACVAACKARGSTPVGIREGRASSRPRAAETAAPHAGGAGSGRIWRAAILAAAVLAVVGGVWLLLGRGEAPPPAKPDHVQKPKVEKPPAAPRPKSVPGKPAAPAETAPPPEEEPAAPSDFQATYPRTPGHLPLPGGNVITFKPPAPGCTTEVFTVGGLYLCDSEGNFVKYEPPKLFDNRFENTVEALSMNRTLILSPRTKQFSREEIEKYLSRPITINADDPPDIVERKTATAAMKEEIRGFIKDGGTYQGYVDLLHDRISSERSLHREAMREMVNLLAEGDVEGARMYRQQIDKFLSDNGYLGLKLPDEWQRKLDGKPEPEPDEN